jgi:hypothetical protein
MAVGRVYDGAVAAAVAADPSVGTENFVIPVVGECDDGWLNDARTVQVEAADVQRALDAAGNDVGGGRRRRRKRDDLLRLERRHRHCQPARRRCPRRLSSR